MIQIRSLPGGITLRCIPDRRFKHGILGIQFLRPMCRQEAAMNALIPAVLLRGSRTCPDLRDITLRLDDLYGASIGAQVRRVGDCQTTGLFSSFMEDRFALPGDRVLEPVVEFLRELLLEPAMENGVFRADYVEGEKKNLISTLEANRNDKQAYAMDQLLRLMCSGDSYGLPRLGEIEDVKAITAQSLYDHYKKVLRESPVEIFCVGDMDIDRLAQLLTPVFSGMDRMPGERPVQTAMTAAPGGSHSQTMDVSQGKLCMGFVTPTTLRDEDFPAMQMLNMILGGGMTSKLFMQLREKMSLCYAIHSGYHGAKGIVTVSAGIDTGNGEKARQEILRQLQLCREGEISQEEMNAARQALLTSLEAVHDSPGSMENYYATAALSGLKLTPEAYMQTLLEVTREQVVEQAKKLTLHTEFFLKGAKG